MWIRESDGLKTRRKLDNLTKVRAYACLSIPELLKRTDFFSIIWLVVDFLRVVGDPPGHFHLATLRGGTLIFLLLDNVPGVPCRTI